jgi:hypothetical protein
VRENVALCSSRYALESAFLCIFCEVDPRFFENGELLEAAENGKFDVLVTVDRGMEYQQDFGSQMNWCPETDAEP